MKKLIVLLSCLGLFVLSPSYAATKKYGKALCSNNGDFYCVKIKKGESWKKLFPDAENRDLVKRINRMNVKLRRGMTIAVPNDLTWLDLEDVSPFPDYIEDTDRKVIIFDPKKLAWGAYDEDGQLVKWGPASGGATWCADVGRGCKTSGGEFTMYRKKGASCVSGKFPIGTGGAPMPHCMFFNRGFAMHGSPIVPGHNASHGCVRLFNEDAKWLNEEFIQLKETKVIVLPYGQYNTEV